jgi:hypothetical protein
MKEIRTRALRSNWKRTLFAVVSLLFLAGLVTTITRYRTKPDPAAAVGGAPGTYATRFGTSGQFRADMVSQTNIKRIRTQFVWGGTQLSVTDNTNGVIRAGDGGDFAKARAAERAGIQVLGMLGYAPPWARNATCQANQTDGNTANGEGKADKCEPRDADEYAKWAGAMAKHYSKEDDPNTATYDGNGGIHHWELWNEQNHGGFWRSASNGVNPDLYAEMVIKAYLAIKDADSSAQVYIGGMAPLGAFTPDPDAATIEPRTFLREMYKAAQARGKNLTDYFDGLAHHPYTYSSATASNPVPDNFDNIRGWYMMHRNVLVDQVQVDGKWQDGGPKSGMDPTCPTPATSATVAQRTSLLDTNFPIPPDSDHTNLKRPSLLCIMNVYGRKAGQKIHSTESGFPHVTNYKGSVNFTTASVQTDYINKFFTEWLKYSWTGVFYYFSFIDNVENGYEGDWQGLVQRDGRGPTPSPDPGAQDNFGCDSSNNPTGWARKKFCVYNAKLDDLLPGGTAAPGVDLSVSDTTITAGSQVTLTWTVSGNADSCTGTGGGLTGWNGDRARANGTHTLNINPGSTRTYTLTCSNEGGSTSADVTVTVGLVPTVQLAAMPTTVTSGGSSTLTWTVNNDANSCTASGNWTGSKTATGGTQTMTGITTNKTYNLVCSNDFGSSTPLATATVTVSASTPPTVNFSVNKPTMKAGESAVLTWNTSNATTCTAAGNWSGTKATSGTLTVSPIVDVLYNLTCTGPGGSNSANTGIDVTPSGKLGDVNNPPNGDGLVNNDDLAFLIVRWGTANARCDLDNDGIVSHWDLSKLASLYGT